MFFGQNVHMPWVSDGPKSNHPPADEIHCNLASIHQTWLWIAHSCSTRTYSNIYSDADTQTQIAHTRVARKFLGGYFWAALLFIIVVVIVVINMMITMTMTMPTTTTICRPRCRRHHDSYPESSSIASASRVWLATGRVCRKSVMYAAKISAFTFSSLSTNKGKQNIQICYRKYAPIDGMGW